MNGKTASDMMKQANEFPENVPAIEEESLSNGEVKTYKFRWDGTNPIRTTVCWTDPPHNSILGLDTPIKALVNDLDIRISAPDSTVFDPWKLDLAQKKNPASTGDNDVDNVEQIYIGTPTLEGDYTLTVNHKGTLGSPQTFSLIISGQQEIVGPVVVNPIPDQTITDDSTYEYTVPESTFNDPTNSVLTFATTLDNNDPLPDWLFFDSGTRVFSGIPDIGDDGIYRIKVTVTNVENQSISDVFVLTVQHINRLPSISDIQDTSTNENFSTAAINFTVGDIETVADDLIISGSSSNIGLVTNNNIVFKGSGTDRYLIITPTADMFGTTIITVSAFDASDIVSDIFVLTVIEYQAPSNVDRSTIAGQADIGGSVGINLDADYQDSWEIVYDGGSAELTGDINTYTLVNIRADVSTVVVRALGLDTFGFLKQDEVVLSIPFAVAEMSNLAQVPDSSVSGVPFGTEMIITLDSINAINVKIDGKAMIPTHDPNTARENSWTFSHTAQNTENLPITITTPGNPPSEIENGSVDISLEKGGNADE